LVAANRDTIVDFSVLDDTIKLENAVFTGLAAGALAANRFQIGANANDVNDRIIYDSANGRLYFDADGLGGAAKIHFATLDAGLALTAADFIVI
jgi:Ca2+-binding RTX toxin-like protein